MRFLLLIITALFTLSTAYAGVTVEGAAKGIEEVQTIYYDSINNQFVLNGGAVLKSPVSSDELLDLLEALKLDDRIGVSVKLSNELIVYGKLYKRSEAAKKLEAADNLLRAVVYAESKLLRGHTLPAGYRPERARNRKRASVIYLNIDNFTFQKTGANYWPVSQDADIVLIPMAKYTAPDGGYLPDYDALEKGDFQKEDKANTDHILQNQAAYEKMPTIASAIEVGRATAFLRHFRDCGISIDQLIATIKDKDSKTLTSDSRKMIVEEKATTEKAQTKVYAESIRRIFEIDSKLGNENKVKLTRSSINDGSYVAFRKKYLKDIKEMPLKDTPDDFATAFKAHGKAWDETLKWLEGKKIEEGKAEFRKFSNSHAPYRRQLRTTFIKCKEIAGKYGVSVE